MIVNSQRKSSRSAPQPLVAPIARNECWTLSFVNCELFGGHPIRALTVVDQFTRECPVIGINFQYPSWQVVKTLSAAVKTHGRPQRLRVANERAFKAPDLDLWAFTESIGLEFISALHPHDAEVSQALNESFRKGCLDRNWFASLDDARRKTELWRKDYNDHGPQTALGGLSPAAFARRQLRVPTRLLPAQPRSSVSQSAAPVGWKPVTES